MQRAEAPIGVFDSGVGGLTVMREIIRQIPKERVVYFGDTARVPYGNKSRDTILKYSRQIIRFLKTKEVKTIVVACNTASAVALEEIREELDIPIIGVIKPGAKTAIKATRNGKIGIIGTETTVRSKIYSHFIQDLNPNLTVIGKACPLFVPLVEEGEFLKSSIAAEIATHYLKDLKKEGIDTLILGCTHYPLMRKLIGQIMGEQVILVNPAYETARGLKELLKQKGLENQKEIAESENPYAFYVSDTVDKFQQFAENILTYSAENTMKINIEDY